MAKIGSETSDTAGMSAIRKATRVLHRLAASGELTAGELADALEEPVTTVYRMLTNLEGIGWIERGSRKGSPVRLGVELIALGQSVEDALDPRLLSRAALVRLNEATSETAYLCVPSGQRATCIERVDGIYTRTAELPIGGSLPLHQGAGPRAILAFTSQLFRDRYTATMRASQLNPMTESEALRLDAELASIRASGLASSDGDVTPGVYSVAAPVMNHRGEVIASITLSALKSRTDTRMLAFDDLVRDEARRVSTDLGFRHADS
ncbi:IclR family transcriptional regulator [Promicromonospora panici]|uniref:IclR family transcriptional regulator n=1 Tax=Promicromonospora panici TaxID=2219658 RepID=UPI00101CEBE0|nr:IclR family transcriptional regulator [Promicromonospora panici]